jgi:hypothetical protein
MFYMEEKNDRQSSALFLTLSAVVVQIFGELVFFLAKLQCKACESLIMTVRLVVCCPI